jgi:hypothetical protein
MGRLRIARPWTGRPRTQPGRVLGDGAYFSSANRAHLRRREIKATIPQPTDQVASRLRRGRTGERPPAFDPAAYKRPGPSSKDKSADCVQASTAMAGGQPNRTAFCSLDFVDVAARRHRRRPRPVIPVCVVSVGREGVPVVASPSSRVLTSAKLVVQWADHSLI